MRGWRGCRDDQPGGFTSSSLDLPSHYQGYFGRPGRSDQSADLRAALLGGRIRMRPCLKACWRGEKKKPSTDCSTATRAKKQPPLSNMS